MRKTLAIIAAIAFSSGLAGCFSRDDNPDTAVVVDSPEASPSVVNYRNDIGTVTAVAAPKWAYPEGSFIALDFTITNNGTEAAAYEVVFAVYDSTQTHVGTVLVSTDGSGKGRVLPGRTMRISGPYGMADGTKVPEGFTVAVETVDRITEVG